MANSTPPPPKSSPISISTPVAIIAAGALMGLGLFFGLRSQPSAQPSSALPVTALPSDAPVAPLLLGPGPVRSVTAEPTAPAPTTTPHADSKAVAAQAKAALDQHKKMIIEQCLSPSLAKKPEPKTVNLSFNFSFDANGKQLTRGISEDRQTSRADVTQCVQAKLPAISVPPPGAGVFVEGIDWVLP